MKKKLIYLGLASILALGIYSLTSTKDVSLFQDNLEALADEPVKIPCSLDGKGCKFEVEATEETETTQESQEEGLILTIENMKNAK